MNALGAPVYIYIIIYIYLLLLLLINKSINNIHKPLYTNGFAIHLTHHKPCNAFSHHSLNLVNDSLPCSFL